MPNIGKVASNLQDQLLREYEKRVIVSGKLIACIRDQFTALIDSHDIVLGVPIESRVKTWDSVLDKSRRKPSININIDDFEDVAGVRFILLFHKDVDKLHNIITETMTVHSSENTGDRLTDNQFGYQSNHYIVEVPEAWSRIPSYKGIAGARAEIQVRTVAQHIWAAASHKLQYKREESVPAELRRTIHRVSALLETVDLELARVLNERDEYNISISSSLLHEELNVNLLYRILSEIYPKDNADDDDIEKIDDLLEDLSKIDITNVGALRELLSSTFQDVMDYEKTRVSKSSLEDYGYEDFDRYKRGVFFSWVGLARRAMDIRVC